MSMTAQFIRQARRALTFTFREESLTVPSVS